VCVSKISQIISSGSCDWLGSDSGDDHGPRNGRRLGQVHDERADHLQEAARQSRPARSHLLLGAHVRPGLQVPQNQDQQVSTVLIHQL